MAHYPAPRAVRNPSRNPHPPSLADYCPLMPKLVTALNVMIASPGDIPEVREAAYNALNLWNSTYAMSRNIALIPLRWETAAPLLGGHPQYIINKQLTDEADILMAFFGSKLGTATPEAPSGTAEEIRSVERLGKPVHVYFSHLGHAPDVDPAGLVQLHEFRSQLGENGLYANFKTLDELQYMIWRAIDLDIARLEVTSTEKVDPVAARETSTNTTEAATTTLAPGASEALMSVAAKRTGGDKSRPVAPDEDLGVLFHLQGGSERVEATNKQGRLTLRTRHWVEVTNRGSKKASSVALESMTDGVIITGNGNLGNVHPQQTRKIEFVRALQASDPRMRISWTENGRTFIQEWDI